jgi:DNA-binding NarL/FixJ family response regulator
VRTVADGAALLDPALTRRLIEEWVRRPPPSADVPEVLRRLTPRELEVFRELARGRSNAEIAALLVLSETTVKSHVGHVLDKLGLRDRVQAVVLGYECGLVRPGEGG